MPDKSGFFYVTEQVARYAIQAQPQSKQKQDTLHELDTIPKELYTGLIAVREYITGRLFMLLGNVARDHKRTNPAQNFTIMTSEKNFCTLIHDNIEDTLGLDPSQPSYDPFWKTLSGDFYNWVKENQKRVGDYYKLDDKGNIIFGHRAI